MKTRGNPRRNVPSLLDPAIIRPAIWDAFRKLDPRLMIRNPVMFVVEIVCVLTPIIYLRDLGTGEDAAEGGGKAQAATLREARTDTRAKRLIDPYGRSGMKDVVEGVSAIDLKTGTGNGAGRRTKQLSSKSRKTKSHT